MAAGKRVVLATHGTLGDVHPYLALALELQRRGHRPVIATNEFYRRKVEEKGIAFHAVRPDFSYDDSSLHERLTEPRRGFERVIRELMLPRLRQTYEDLLAAVRNADLLVSQILMFAAPLVAERTSVRWISTELQPGAFLSIYDPPVLAPVPALARLRGLGPAFHAAVFGIAKMTARRWGKPVLRLRKELGLSLDNDPLFSGRSSPQLHLALFSRVMGPPQRDWPPNTAITGFPFYDENDSPLPPEIDRFVDSGEPPVVFTIGSSAVWNAGTFFEESVDVARRLGMRAVLVVGKDPRNRITQPLPEQIMTTAYAPYAALFSRAAAVVHHGGIGTTGQVLRAGKPMLVMPFGGDQYDNAARIERLGVGRTIMRRQFTGSRAAAPLRELLASATVRDRAAEIGRQVRAEDGVRAACDAIESASRNG
ncbi:MAG TPA: glycosyltransferase [Thermoanaerobaculia bacterium]|nr:glycosyltransferase [Thermoanaerobaculia bacterium]